MHICVSKLTIIGSDNGLSPGRRQAIVWINAGILLIEPLGTIFSEILIKIHTCSFKKMHLKMASISSRPQCVNSFWPTDAIWWHWSGSTLVYIMACCLMASTHYLNLCWLMNWSGSTLVYVMACCLMAPTHYLNLCWLIKNEVLWHSSKANSTGSAQDINL